MPGTRIGGQRAAITIKRKYGESFYRVQGARGGRASTTGGFWHAKYVKKDVESIREASRLGAISRRGDKPQVKKRWWDIKR